MNAGNDRRKLAIVGGGAAGLAAAIAAGERARDLGIPLEIVVYERDDRVGRSILATGNGRCNFSNEHPRAADYHNAGFVGDALLALSASYSRAASHRELGIIRDNGHEVNAFFYCHGLMWRTEDDGRQYPQTNKASTVVDILRGSAVRLGVREACDCTVAAIDVSRDGSRITLRMADGVLERADALIVACGGRMLSALDVCGFSVVEQRPVLGPLRCEETPETRELDNIRVRCVVALERREGGVVREIARERGELMFRKYGVSGICVFNLSRFARKGDTLRVNFLMAKEMADAKQFLFSRRKLLTGTYGNGLTFEDIVRGLILPRVGDVLLKRIGVRPGDRFEKGDVGRLANVLSGYTLTVAGIGDESLCQVRRGGLDVGEFDPQTMASRGVPNLYAVGEALDVDGPCGGYNLHWAWASGLLAGRSCVERLAENMN